MVDWNPGNEDILAVGYGKYYYKDKAKGMVMIWNIKNPVQPERTYHFEAAVTSLQFSRKNFNALAVGMYNGKLEILDISFKEKQIIRQNSRKLSSTYEALWQVLWYQDDEYYKGEEQVITAGQDGRILKFRRTGTINYNAIQIMQVSRAEGKLKGIEILRRCNVSGISITSRSPALVITRHPVDPNVYFVGTGEGVVHRCSTDYCHQHLDLFVAHDGPMYQLKFSTFCDRLFMTCGEDWTARIWCYGTQLNFTLYSIQ